MLENSYASDPASFTSAVAGSAYSQFAVQDYGSVGDQRPYQIVHPAYPAPQFLQSFNYLTEALRECDTLCRSTGVPFRLVKWGARIPCMPCKGRKIRDSALPSFRMRKYVESRGALEGYPEATPIAEMLPNGQRIIFGPDGQEQFIGQPDYKIFSTPFPPSDLYAPAPLPMNYIQAIRAGEYLSSHQGREAFVCSSFGADCKGRNPKLWVPVVYVQPGGLARRYPEGLPVGQFGTSSVPGSTVISQPITPDMFQQMIALSQGGSNLPWNAT